MMKKRTAAFFILLANIIILAHAVVPHHHLPQNAFVIISSRCNENKDGHHHPRDNQSHNHENNNKNDNDLCSLKQAIGIPTNIHRVGSSNDLHANMHPNFVGFHAIMANFQFDCIVPSISVDLQPSFLTSTYARYASSFLSLHAPPTIYQSFSKMCMFTI